MDYHYVLSNLQYKFVDVKFVFIIIIFLKLVASESGNWHTNILKVVISLFLRLVFAHIYFTAPFYIININYLLVVSYT